MLARPEIGTREHILLWLAGKDPNEEYLWESYCDCACGRYAKEVLGKSNMWWSAYAMTPAGTPFMELNHLAMDLKTFGELYERARKRWSSDRQ